MTDLYIMYRLDQADLSVLRDDLIGHPAVEGLWITGTPYFPEPTVTA